MFATGSQVLVPVTGLSTAEAAHKTLQSLEPSHNAVWLEDSPGSSKQMGLSGSAGKGSQESRETPPNGERLKSQLLQAAILDGWEWVWK